MTQILASVRAGSTLARRLEVKTFPLYIAMVRAGEAGGSLEANLEQLAIDLKPGAGTEATENYYALSTGDAGGNFFALALLLVYILPVSVSFCSNR